MRMGQCNMSKITRPNSNFVATTSLSNRVSRAYIVSRSNSSSSFKRSTSNDRRTATYALCSGVSGTMSATHSRSWESPVRHRRCDLLLLADRSIPCVRKVWRAGRGGMAICRSRSSFNSVLSDMLCTPTMGLFERVQPPFNAKLNRINGTQTMLKLLWNVVGVIPSQRWSSHAFSFGIVILGIAVRSPGL